jgi:predicted dithiol-disulfide oxidoreductase (DUF899 family)
VKLNDGFPQMPLFFGSTGVTPFPLLFLLKKMVVMIPSIEREGVSVFYKDPADRVYHTYSAYARGIDMLNVAYHYLDLVPKGRDEAGHEFPQFWVRRHDEYGK